MFREKQIYSSFVLKRTIDDNFEKFTDISFRIFIEIFIKIIPLGVGSNTPIFYFFFTPYFFIFYWPFLDSTDEGHTGPKRLKF